MVFTEINLIICLVNLSSLGLSFYISSDHDILLEKIDEWDKLKKEDALVAGHIELASLDSVIERMQGKRPVDYTGPLLYFSKSESR